MYYNLYYATRVCPLTSNSRVSSKLYVLLDVVSVSHVVSDQLLTKISPSTHLDYHFAGLLIRSI